MLSRVLEPEIMDSRREAVDYDAMDHRDVNVRFVEDLLAAAATRSVTDSPGAELLDLGTGTAQQPVILCQKWKQIRVVATDAAGHMLAVAGRNVAAARFGERISLVRCDAKKLPFEDARFTVVMSNSIVHHVPEPRRVFREAIRVTSVGGQLFFRDLLRPATPAELERLVALYASGANPHQRKLFSDSLHAALTIPEVLDIVTSLGFAEQTVQQTSDRHWTWAAGRED